MEPASTRSQTTERPPLDKPGFSAPVVLSMVAALAAGLALRVWMFIAFPQNSGDPQIYGGIAKNLLHHSQYAISDGSGVVHSTLIRLPGYPLFLALLFSLFGFDNFTAVAGVQVVLDLVACLLLYDFVRRIASQRAAQCTLWLAALCPFTADYASAALTEGPTLFVISLALWSLQHFREKPGWSNALIFTGAVTYAALLRPDGALVGVALAPALFIAINRHNGGAQIQISRLIRIATVCLLLALTPFAIWTARNWRAFHVIEPLAPRYATDPGEAINSGWQRWVKTWCLDFVSTYYIYWNVPGDKFDLDKLPSRAFDSPAQYAETAAIAKAYEDNGEDISPAIDAQFAHIADERIAAHPLRYYLWLPLGRVADMWLRPRVENLPIDFDWWVYSHHNAETRFSWLYAALNAFYILLGIAGVCLRPRYWPFMLAYFVMRSALLADIEAPEARYTIECFPMLFALGGIALYRLTNWVFESVLNVKASLGSA